MTDREQANNNSEAGHGNDSALETLSKFTHKQIEEYKHKSVVIFTPRQ